MKDPSSPDGSDAAPLEARLAVGFARRFTTVSFSSHVTGRSVWGEAFADMPPDITITHPDFHSYAGRLFYNRPGQITVRNEHWQDTFRLLARSASLILSIPIDASPAAQPSATIDELLDLRADDLLEKCIFVMPPEQSVLMIRPAEEQEGLHVTMTGWLPTEAKMSSLWESTRVKLAKSGFKFPEFRDTAEGVTLFILRGGEYSLLPVTRRELRKPSQYLRNLNMKLPGF